MRLFAATFAPRGRDRAICFNHAAVARCSGVASRTSGRKPPSKLPLATRPPNFHEQSNVEARIPKESARLRRGPDRPKTAGSPERIRPSEAAHRAKRKGMSRLEY